MGGASNYPDMPGRIDGAVYPMAVPFDSEASVETLVARAVAALPGDLEAVSVVGYGAHTNDVGKTFFVVNLEVRGKR